MDQRQQKMSKKSRRSRHIHWAASLGQRSIQNQPVLLAPGTLDNFAIDSLCKSIKRQLNGREPHKFQVEMVRAQEERRDALCHAATGMGKTLVAAAPHLLEHNKGRVSLVVSPLVALQNEMVCNYPPAIQSLVVLMTCVLFWCR